MSQLLLTHSSQFHRTIRTESTFPLSLRIGKFFLIFVMTTMIGILSFFYLAEFTQIQTKGYQLHKLEIENDMLTTSRERKTTDIARLKSLQAIQTSDVAGRMIPMKNAVFVKEDAGFATLPRTRGSDLN